MKGSRTTNSVSPGTLFTTMVPWWALTTAATIDANGSFSVGEIQFTTTTSGTTPPITVNNSQNGIITLTNAVGVLVQTKQTNPVVLNTNLALGNAAVGNVTTFQTTQATTVNGIISGSGNLLKIGSAFLALKGVNTYVGTTVVQQNTDGRHGRVGGPVHGRSDNQHIDVGCTQSSTFAWASAHAGER